MRRASSRVSCLAVAAIVAACSGGAASPTTAPSRRASRQIVFSHFPSAGGVSDLFVMNRDGSELRVLAATALNENGPVWGPLPTD